MSNLPDGRYGRNSNVYKSLQVYSSLPAVSNNASYDLLQEKYDHRDEAATAIRGIVFVPRKYDGSTMTRHTTPRC